MQGGVQGGVQGESKYSPEGRIHVEQPMVVLPKVLHFSAPPEGLAPWNVVPLSLKGHRKFTHINIY